MTATSERSSRPERRYLGGLRRDSRHHRVAAFAPVHLCHWRRGMRMPGAIGRPGCGCRSVRAIVGGTVALLFLASCEGAPPPRVPAPNPALARDGGDPSVIYTEFSQSVAALESQVLRSLDASQRAQFKG